MTALADLRRRYKKDKAGMLSQEYIAPKVVMTPQDSFYAEKESLPLKETKGRICSEFVMCYPPGIPVLAPGEEINKIGDYYAFGREMVNGDSIYDFDPTKLSIHTLDIGLAGIEVYDILRD